MTLTPAVGIDDQALTLPSGDAGAVRFTRNRVQPMKSPAGSPRAAEFLAAARARVLATFDAVLVNAVADVDAAQLGQLRGHFEPGKMLRSRLGAALADALPTPSRDTAVACCAATELIHTATLFHDDVIDGASMRRAQPALWRDIGATGAILVGDLFFSCALELVIATGDLKRTASFVAKVREVCATETVHEIVFSGQDADAAVCRRIARGKTGPLFAFAAECCGVGPEMGAALAEAGYCVGTAYQIADDLLDEIGDEAVIGKTLGTDRKRRKYTLAQDGRFSEAAIRSEISDLCEQAVEHVRPWPAQERALMAYIEAEMAPLWEPHMEPVG
jgi:geranylgeranyl pyrophosphate synthase